MPIPVPAARRWPACWGSNTSGPTRRQHRHLPVPAGGRERPQVRATGSQRRSPRASTGPTAPCAVGGISPGQPATARIYRRTPVAVNRLGIGRAIDAGGSLPVVGCGRRAGLLGQQLLQPTRRRDDRPTPGAGCHEPGLFPVHSFSTGLVHDAWCRRWRRAACVGWNAYGQLGGGPS